MTSCQCSLVQHCNGPATCLYIYIVRYENRVRLRRLTRRFVAAYCVCRRGARRHHHRSTQPECCRTNTASQGSSTPSMRTYRPPSTPHWSAPVMAFTSTSSLSQLLACFTMCAASPRRPRSPSLDSTRLRIAGAHTKYKKSGVIQYASEIRGFHPAPFMDNLRGKKPLVYVNDCI